MYFNLPSVCAVHFEAAHMHVECTRRRYVCACNVFGDDMHKCAMHLEVACMCVQCVCCWSKNELNEPKGSPVDKWMYCVHTNPCISMGEEGFPAFHACTLNLLMPSPACAHQTGGRAPRWLGSRSRELGCWDENGFRATKRSVFLQPIGITSGAPEAPLLQGTAPIHLTVSRTFYHSLS